MVPVQITYHGISHSDVVDALVREEVAALERFFGRVVSCRTFIEKATARQVRGAPFHIRIELDVPGKELVIGHEANVRDSEALDGVSRLTKSSEITAEHKEVHLAIRDAFHKVRRRLQDYTGRKAEMLKAREEPLTGQVLRLGEDYGFLQTHDGREVYFHCNSVKKGGFDHLSVGSTVHYTEEEGEQGPQAASVSL